MQNPRRKETEEAYQQFKQQAAHNPDTLNTFDFAQETILREYEHWLIIKNRFPYDGMTRRNDLLVSRTPLETLYHAPAAQQEEYHRIIQELAQEGLYDALIENFPRTKTVTRFVHIHLIQWHNTADR